MAIYRPQATRQRRQNRFADEETRLESTIYGPKDSIRHDSQTVQFVEDPMSTDVGT